ncbi:MAG: SH3 domain-containing protein [Anaerolineae bacterium]|jgi:uncharacterized protein YraI|nr:SH3 domain-containing protein [Anaerolineae bacterium]
MHRFPRWFALLLLVGLLALQLFAQSGVRALVVNESANVRVAPALGAEVIANVPSGYVFEFVTGRSGDSQWLRVDFNGDEGWVNLAPLVILEGDINVLPVGDPRTIPYGGFGSPRAGSSNATSANVVRATDGLRVRAGPGTAYPTISNINAGTIVPVFGRTASNGWIQVNYQGTLGWVATRYVEFLNGLAIISLPIDGIVADSAPISGETSNDYFDTLRLMLARLELAQPSLDNIRAKWTDASLQGRATCRDYPARPSDFSIPVPTLAAFYNELNPLLVDFNDAMFNLRRAIDLFIDTCNQPGLGNPVGAATSIGALDIVNLVDGQFTSLRGRIRGLLPPDRPLQPNECLFTYRTRAEILNIIATEQIVRFRYDGRDTIFGFCIDLIQNQTLAFQAIQIRGAAAIQFVLAPFDNPTNFIVSQRSSGGAEFFVAPILVPQTTRYLLIIDFDPSQEGQAIIPGDVAFVLNVVPASGLVGRLLYDPNTDTVSQVATTVSTPVPTATGSTAASGVFGVCPSLTYTCGQLFSCQEARACLAAGNSALDPDGNGIPCENLCTP